MEQKAYPIRIRHNFDEREFSYFWGMYVRSGNLQHHCLRCLNGTKSKQTWGEGHELSQHPELVMDEVATDKYRALYLCGGSRKGYAHNVHLVITPKPGATATWDFDGWHVDIENGELSPIPAEERLDDRFFAAPYDDHYTTCRNFRWMVGFFYPELIKPNS